MHSYIIVWSCLNRYMQLQLANVQPIEIPDQGVPRFGQGVPRFGQGVPRFGQESTYLTFGPLVRCIIITYRNTRPTLFIIFNGKFSS